MDNDHQFLARPGHDLLPQQCSAETLDKIQIPFFDLIRAVDRDIESRFPSQTREWNPQGLCLGGCPFRCGYAHDA
jgi:acyl-coenzyme A thioesterase PaaI-like protein